MLRKMEGKGRYETAKRLRSTCSQIFRYAIATARADRDVAADLRGALIVAGRSASLSLLPEPDTRSSAWRYPQAAVPYYPVMSCPTRYQRPKMVAWGRLSTSNNSSRTGALRVDLSSRIRRASSKAYAG